MKTIFVIPFCIFMLVLSHFSCKKKEDESRGTIFISGFNTASDLNLWTQSAYGEAVIEADYLKLKSLSGCFVFETVDLISVKKGKTYTLKFKGKLVSPLIGDPAYCVGPYMIYVVQGSEFLIMEGFGDYSDWTQKSFAFEAPSSAGVKIRFLIGTEKGAWLDDLELIED